MTKIKNALKSVVGKSIVLTILPAAYSILGSFAFSAEAGNNQMNLFVICAVCLLCHIVALIYYGRIENIRQDALEELQRIKENAPKELKNIQGLLQSYEKVVFDNADKMYQTVIKKQDHKDIQDWSWIQAQGDEVCNALYRFIVDIAERGSEFAVSIILKKNEDGVKGYTMSSRKASDASHTPKSYRHFVTEGEVESEGKYYKKILDNPPGEPVILLNKREIANKFSKDSGGYSQYIALPISCTGRKPVGIMQIAVYNDSRLSQDRRTIKRFCDNYFELGSRIMLLTYKNENIHQLIE